MRELARRVGDSAQELQERRVVVLPDFFLDRFVPVPSWDAFSERVAAIHGRGGGNLPTRPQTLRVGGDAGNTAYALGRLGVPVRLVAHADGAGRELLARVLGPLGVDLAGVQDAERSASTVALEFEDGANVMLSDAGPLASVSPDDLTGEDWAAVEGADAVLFGNWSQAREHGTELLAAVLERAQGLTMLDTSDPTHRPEQDAADLLHHPAVRDHLDVWAMNEAEARHFGRLAADGDPGGWQDAVAAVATVFPGRIDAHTADAALTLHAGRRVRTPTVPLTPKHRTGAGDAWNAGDLLGYLLRLDEPERLEVANAVAGVLLTDETHRPPTLGALAAWLDERPVREDATMTDL